MSRLVFAGVFVKTRPTAISRLRHQRPSWCGWSPMLVQPTLSST